MTSEPIINLKQIKVQDFVREAMDTAGMSCKLYSWSEVPIDIACIIIIGPGAQGAADAMEAKIQEARLELAKLTGSE